MTALNVPTPEIRTVWSLVAHLDQIAKVHAGISGNEGFLGSLKRMEVGEGDLQLVREAQAKSKLAEEKWATAAEQIRRSNLPVNEAYSASPNAANKHANTNE